MNRAHTAFATSVGFCFGIAGFILSVLSAIVSAVLAIDRKSSLVVDHSNRPTHLVGVQGRGGRPRSPLHMRQTRNRFTPHPPSRRKLAIPTITMTHAEDDDDWNSDSAAPLQINTSAETELRTEPFRYLDETKPLLRSLSLPQLTMIPASSFLQLPKPERRGKRRSIRMKNGRHKSKDEHNG